MNLLYNPVVATGQEIFGIFYWDFQKKNKIRKECKIVLLLNRIGKENNMQI